MSKKLLFIILFLSLGLVVTACSSYYSIETEVSDGGVIKISPTQDEYEEGKEITLEAVSDSSYDFVEWSGDLESEDNPVELEIDADINIEAQFKKRMVLIESGKTSEDNGSLTVEDDFYIGKYQVTQEEFEEVMGFNPSEFNDDDHPDLEGNTTNRPVERVTWYDAVKYANQLSELEGLDKYYDISNIEYDGDNIDSATVTENKGANGYRLPTADEHEYAARGGEKGNTTTYAGSDNLDEVGWYRDNSDVANSNRWNNRGTMPVGEKESNELGIYDMSGNVWDWTNTSSGSNHIKQEGSWNSNIYFCHIGNSISNNPSNSNSSIGFRLARRP